jgi:ATP synthase protein I
MEDDTNARNPVGEDQRMTALDERIKAVREREEARTKPTAGAEADANYRMGSRVLAELIGGSAAELSLAGSSTRPLGGSRTGVCWW